MQPASYIDLHSHTNESDGSYSPEDLISLAVRTGLKALAITDHDTFAGYNTALPFAQRSGLQLVCGIELNTRMNAEVGPHHRSVHLLAYFLDGSPTARFTEWLAGEQAERRSRNGRLAEELQKIGIPISLAEVEARGKSLAGRPHFARILVEKGYARSSNEAFSKFLGEEAPSFVPRDSKTAEEAIQLVRAAGGVPVVAHPIRLGLPREKERQLLVEYRSAGLLGVEVFHSEHPPELQVYYHQLTAELDLLPTGGSDFHGSIKPDIQLGTGMDGNVRVPFAFLEALRQKVGA